MNPMQIVQMIKGGQNPQQIMLQFLEQSMGNTPFGMNLMDLVKNNKYQDIEKIARNMAREKGLDFDSEFAAFKERFGL